MVFDPAEAPRDRERFKEWYARTTGWSESQDYNDPNVTAPQPRAWYDDIRASFPNMNGLGAPTDDDLMTLGVEDRLADYTFAHHAIHATFAWSEAESVYPVVRDLAVKHEVGFYDVSGDEGGGEIHFPGDALSPASGGKWREIAKQFRELKQ